MAKACLKWKFWLNLIFKCGIDITFTIFSKKKKKTFALHQILDGPVINWNVNFNDKGST